MPDEKPGVKPNEGDTNVAPVSETPAETKPNVETVPGEVDAGAKEPEAQAAPQRSNLEFELLRRREQAKKYQEEREKLKADLAEKESLLAQYQQAAPPSSAGDLPVTLEEAKKLVRSEMESERIEGLKEQALNYILSQPDVTRNDLADISQIMKDRGLDDLGNKRPLEAAMTALDVWRVTSRSKVDGKLKEEAKTIGGGSTSANSVPALGKKVWTRGEIDAIPVAEYPKFRDEIYTAFKEGRVR